MSLELFLIDLAEKFFGKTAVMFYGITSFLSGLFFGLLQYLNYIPINPQYETSMVIVSGVMVIGGLGFIIMEFDRKCFMGALLYVYRLYYLL